MELENMKEMWQKEDISNAPEISLEKQNEIHLPLEKIRKNMKMEIWLNVIAVLLLLPLSKVFSENAFLRWSMMSVYTIIIGYFTWRFYVFMKKTESFKFDTLYSLQETKFELKLLKELYSAYYVSSIPFILAMLCMFIMKKGADFSKAPELGIRAAPYLMFFVATAIVLGIGYWWFSNYYGKYIKQMDKLINNLK